MIDIICSFPYDKELPKGFQIIPYQPGLQLTPYQIWINDYPWDDSYSSGQIDASRHPWNHRVWVKNTVPSSLPGTPQYENFIHPTLRRAEEQGLRVVSTHEEAIEAAIQIGRGQAKNMFAPEYRRVISLAKRQDRRKEMKENWENAGQILDDSVWQVAEVAPKPKFGAQACRKSHVKALETALAENPEGWSLIMEDDAHWIQSHEGKWPDRFPDDDCAIAYLGAAVHQWKESKQDDCWGRPESGWEQVQAWYAHAYAVNGKKIKEILEIIRNAPYNESIDTIYCMIVARRMKCQAWIPTLFTQAPGKSDIEQANIDRTEKVLALDLLIQEHRQQTGVIPATLNLNLRSRADKKEWMQQEFERMKMKPVWWVVDKDEENPVRGCLKSHVGMWREALRRNLPWVLITEDDIEFTGEEIDISTAPADWEMLYFGGNTASVYDNYGNADWKPVQTWSTYGYAIRTSLIADWEHQGLLDKINGAVDQWLLEKVHPNARVYRQTRPWIIPRSGEELSDCTGKQENYDFLRQEADALKKALPTSLPSSPKNALDSTTLPKVSLVTPTLKGREWFWNALHCFLKQDYPSHLLEWVILDEGDSKLADMIPPEETRIQYHCVSNEERKLIYQEFIEKLRKDEAQEKKNAQLAQHTVDLGNGRSAVASTGTPFRKKQRGKGRVNIKREGAPAKLLDVHSQSPWKEGEGDFWRQRLPIGMKRNWLTSLATGDVIVHWDDDDWYPSTSVSLRVKQLIQNNVQMVGCTTIPCFDTTVCMSWMNVPPQTDKLHERLSEATFAYFKSAWEKHKFDPQVIGTEGSLFVKGRENEFKEISYDGVIVSLVHRGNLSSRRRPVGHEPNGWHFGKLPESEFTLITQVDNPDFPHKDWLRAFVLKPFLTKE